MEENQQKLRKAVSDVSLEINKYYNLEVERKFDDIEEVEEAECQCCGLKEECSRLYMSEVEEDYCGKWVCGLCSEAVKDQVRRSTTKVIAIVDALKSQRDFSQEYNSTIRLNPKLSLTSSMRKIARRSLDKRNCKGLGITKLTRSASYP